MCSSSAVLPCAEPPELLGISSFFLHLTHLVSPFFLLCPHFLSLKQSAPCISTDFPKGLFLHAFSAAAFFWGFFWVCLFREGERGHPDDRAK